MISIRLPYPLSANKYWRNVRGRVIVSREAEEYKERVASAAHFAGIHYPIGGLIAVNLLLFPVKPSRWNKMSSEEKEAIRCIDLDNCLKVTFDSFNGRVWFDDSQVRLLRLERFDPVTEGALLVEIERYEPKTLPA